MATGPIVNAIKLDIRHLAAIILLASLASPSFADETDRLAPVDTMGKGQRVLGGGKEALLYEHQGTGCLTHFDKKEKSFSAYRFHDDDPVFFQDGLRLTCRCGETEHGQTGGKQGYLSPPKTRYTTYTWVYQW